jgi:hypothetical protein
MIPLALMGRFLCALCVLCVKGFAYVRKRLSTQRAQRKTEKRKSVEF